MKRFFATILALVMVMALCACGSKNEAPAATPDSGAPAVPEYTIKIGHSDTTANLIHISLENFAKAVNEESKGRLKVEVYAAEQLGSNAEMAEMVSMGNLDAMMMPNGQEASYAPKLNALGLPFLFSNYDQVYAVLDSDVGAALVEDLADSNMIQLAYWENGLRQVTNNTRPIVKPEDLKGLKIRTPEDDMTLAIFNALGASPSPLAFSELYLALQQGTFDGQENPVSNIYANNFQDVQKYLSIVNHKYEPKNMVFSLATWDKLPEDLQTILLDCAATYGQEHRDAIRNSADQMLKELQEAGMEVNTPDTAPFQEATQSVYSEFYAKNEWAEDLVAQMQEIISTVG